VLSPVLDLQYKRDMDTLERVQQKATEITNRLEHLTHEERLRALGLFNFEKKKLGGMLSMCRKA